MTNYIISSVAAALIILSSASISQAKWSPDSFCPYPSEHVTKYPYYGNCTIYWECYDGTRFLVECPAGLEFNAQAQECDAPEIAKCDPYASSTPQPTGPTTSGTTSISTKSPTRVPSTTERHTTSSSGPDPDCPFPSDEMIYYPYPGDCNKYYECSDGHKYVIDCPEGLWWHQEIKECDYPGDYCHNSTSTTPQTTRTTQPQPTEPTTSATTSRSTNSPTTVTSTTERHTTSSSGPDPDCPFPSEENIYYPYPGDCNKYYECSDGHKYVNICPEGLWWHQDVKQCDYPGDYCHNSTSTTPETTTSIKPTSPVTTTSTPPFKCPYPSDIVSYFPYPGDCSKYYECYKGDQYLNQCSGGLWWHNELTECDYPGDYCVQ